MPSLPLAGASRLRCLSGCWGESGQLGSFSLKAPGAPFSVLRSWSLESEPKVLKEEETERPGGPPPSPPEVSPPREKEKSEVQAGMWILFYSKELPCKDGWKVSNGNSRQAQRGCELFSGLK